MSNFHAFCKAQVFRFAGRLGWVDPKENPAPAKDLIEALEFRGSRGSEELAKRITDACVEASQYCPTVPDILRVAQEMRDQESTGPRYGFVGCEECGYSGWRSVVKNGYDYSAACECRGPIAPANSPVKPRELSAASQAIDARMRRAAGDR